ncbi:MAG: ATP-binding cassette domain-containing protein [Proteobacteria bacterium]|nr:ATP-binding cassette domain-containing protein [Pseudomonadota bacterium]
MIVIENVHKRFGKQVVLNGVSLTIEDGKTTAIVGPSGVGKSVLLKLIMGIMAPDSGRIWIGDDNITQASSEHERNRIRGRLGVLFQAAALLDSLTVYENIAFPLEQRTRLSRQQIHSRVEFMLTSLSLEPYAFSLPQQVSIGIRKRVGLARALITEPTTVLFDEPNTGLDPLVGQEVYDLIRACRERWRFTGVVISHEIPEVFQVSDRVAMLLNGDFRAEGTPTELRQSADPAVQQFLQGSTDGPIKIQ